jgi:hypothetical protein
VARHWRISLPLYRRSASLVLEGEYLCLFDFDRKFSDLGALRERLFALGVDRQAFSTEQTATGATIIKIHAQYWLEWLRTLDDMTVLVH